MTTAPPPGWYPDPEAAGRQWRWWDGARWAPPGYGYAPPFDPSAYAHARHEHAGATHNTARWLRWAMVAAAIYGWLGFVVFAATIHELRDGLTDADAFGVGSGRLVALRVVSLPFQIGALGYIALLVAWIYNTGKFAELQRWPAARGRTLGAFSVIIPIVNLWWPYEAIRDSFPPGNAPRVVLHWWLAQLLLGPIFGLLVIVSALAGTTALTITFAIMGAAVIPIPIVLGWRLIDAVDAMQRAHLTGS